MSVLKLLNRHNIVFGDYKWTEFDDVFLNSNVQSVSIVDTELKLKERQPIDLSKSGLSLHIFQLNEEGPSIENLEEENEDIVAANHWVLPAAEFHGLWESLIYDTEVKSQSGKLVSKMFQKIQELIDDKDALVFVLIDEVESLTAARSAFKAGTEPSDAIRVVNAVLMQIDHIKRYPNVVILTTSNITEKIDMAFVDRADIKQYIGPPSAAAIFRIYLSCLEELMKCQIIYPRQHLLSLRELEMIGFVENNVSRLSLVLKEISR
ncbi:hypothetical protein ASZ78_000881 [Callipepla squamata]|uniref:Pachytene checkpoint protein 2 homolog n=1 Tax=Callipepla squamata TaxID=9009 RepID=A0A226N5Z9_CALSU|nr:hypothetical protein ASZ78_000881 [Callipepla squamata]